MTVRRLEVMELVDLLYHYSFLSKNLDMELGRKPLEVFGVLDE